MSPIRHLCLLAALLWPFHSWGESANEALVRATAAVQSAVPRAQADPARPVFHVTSPAQWMNDPNGPLFYRGFYHLFYQLHPFSDQSGPKYWGHVRSRDLVKWEHLPIALAPSTENGESEVWSGCCTLNGNGEPMIFYTSIAQGQAPGTHAEQWAATGDADLIHWRKSPANPVLSEALHGGIKIYEWRDPFIFHHGKRTFMVAGGNLNHTQGGQAVVNIYEAEDAGLTRWKYRGVLFQHPDPQVTTAECPNFFRLGDQWVLFVSPYGHVQYFLGDFDPETCRFTARSRGIMDYGSFYAPNTMLVPDGRRLVWGWINGFPDGHGWNGCLSLPRQLSLSHDGQLRQTPAPQLAKLRGPSVKWRNLPIEQGGHDFMMPGTNSLEIEASFLLKATNGIALEFKSRAPGSKPLTINYDGMELDVAATKAPLRLDARKGELNLRIFIDRSVVEVFANDVVCITKTIPPLDADAVVNVRTAAGAVLLQQLQVWPMRTIW